VQVNIVHDCGLMLERRGHLESILRKMHDRKVLG
jgi:hypothetical protein